jgi:uncharacterized protein (DUF486 family)
MSSPSSLLQPMALSHADPAAVLLESVHDLRLVRPPQIQIRAALHGHLDQLGHCLRGILLRGAGEPVRQRGLFACGLKTIQEVVTLIVFAGFTALNFDEPLSWMQCAGFALIALGAALVFHGQA